MDYVLSVVAAALLGAGYVLQQDEAQQAPSAHFLRVQLLADLLRRPRWLAGLITMVAGELLSAWVIGHLVLSLAEPLLATSLLFALLLAGPMSGQAVHKSEVAGALILMAGVTALSVARSVRSAQLYVGSYAYWPFAGAAVAFLAVVLAELGRRRPADQRAILTGTSAGLVFGIADALTRRTVQILDSGHPAVLLTSWPAYALIAVSLAGLWLMQGAFNAAPLHTSLPGITAAEPLSGTLLGTVVFRDSVHVSPGTIALEASGLIALLVGVIMVARAPALARLRGRQPPHFVAARRAAHQGTAPAKADLRAEIGQSHTWAAIRSGCLNVPAWADDTDIQWSLGEKERAVSASKKAKDKAQAAKGRVKKGAGKAQGDPVLEGKGKAEEAKGNLKQAGEKLKDAAKK